MATGPTTFLLRHLRGAWRSFAVAAGATVRAADPALPSDLDWRIVAPPVHIPDASLRAAVEEALDKPAGAMVGRRELSGLGELVRKSAGVADLTGIEWATGLRTLRVHDNEIRNVAPLAGLVELTTVELGRNRITDITALAQMAGMGHLQLQFNQVVDVTPLAGLRRLRTLYLWDNRIEDVAPLAGLEDLVLLRLDANRLRDISPLAGLRNMTAFSAGRNRIEDVSALAGMTKINWLRLDRAGISDITPLSGLRRVDNLNLDWNEIDDIGPLAGMRGMRLLNFRYNRVAEISALADMKELFTLQMDGNAVVDLSPLAGSTVLRRLDAEGNRIRDIAPLAGLTRLAVLALSRNAIADLSPLSGLTRLEWLELAENLVVDLSPLAGLRELEWLDLGFNAVADVVPLANLTSLRTLYLRGNRIHDLAPLAANTGLGRGDRIDVSWNPLSAESAESAESVVPALAARGARVLAHGVDPVAGGAVFTTVHDDQVVVIDVGEGIASETVYTGLALESYAREFYAHFEDRFDFLLFFSNLDELEQHEAAPYAGIYLAVRNDVDGTGLDRYYTNRYGSAERLKGVIHFPYNRALLFGPALHEIQHAWANYALPTAVHGHWGFSSANGQLGGFDIDDLVELGGGRYAAGRFGTFANGGNRLVYSPIELYFASFIPPEEVPDLWVAADGEWVFEDDDRLARTATGDPIFAARDVATYGVEDIVARNGPRVPAMAEAQWNFRAAVILLTDEDHPATDAQLHTLSAHATAFGMRGSDGYGWLSNFHEATGGRGSMTLDGLSLARKSSPATPRELPASFGVVPLPQASTIDGRCIPVYQPTVARWVARDPVVVAQGSGAGGKPAAATSRSAASVRSAGKGMQNRRY